MRELMLPGRPSSENICIVYDRYPARQESHEEELLHYVANHLPDVINVSGMVNE